MLPREQKVNWKGIPFKYRLLLYWHFVIIFTVDFLLFFWFSEMEVNLKSILSVFIIVMGGKEIKRIIDTRNSRYTKPPDYSKYLILYLILLFFGYALCVLIILILVF